MWLRNHIDANTCARSPIRSAKFVAQKVAYVAE